MVFLWGSNARETHPIFFHHVLKAVHAGAAQAADRRSQVGTGDRAEKIRTYNYGERRVTDHRTKLTVHNLDQVLEGELEELTASLQSEEKRRGLEAQAAV